MKFESETTLAANSAIGNWHRALDRCIVQIQEMQDTGGPVVYSNNGDPANNDTHPTAPPGDNNALGVSDANTNRSEPAHAPQQRKGMLHQIVSGAGDEHHVITTPSGHVLRQHGTNEIPGKRNPPKFSAIMNEYVGACM